MDAQPWWVMEQLPWVAAAHNEVQEARAERERAKAERR